MRLDRPIQSGPASDGHRTWPTLGALRQSALGCVTSRIRPGTALNGVVARITREQVVAGTTGNSIITGTAFDDVIACAARENVGIVLAKYGYRDTADDRNIIDAGGTRQNEAVRINGYANITIFEAKRLDVRDRINIRRRHMGNGDRLAVG